MARHPAGGVNLLGQTSCPQFRSGLGRLAEEVARAAESRGDKASNISQSAASLVGVISVGRARPPRQGLRAAMYLLSFGPHFSIRIAGSEFTRVGTRGSLKYCRLSPPLNSFYEIVDSVYVTALKGNRACSLLSRTGANVRPQHSGQPSRFRRFLLMEGVDAAPACPNLLEWV